MPCYLLMLLPGGAAGRVEGGGVERIWLAFMYMLYYLTMFVCVCLWLSDGQVQQHKKSSTSSVQLKPTSHTQYIYVRDFRFSGGSYLYRDHLVGKLRILNINIYFVGI